MMPPLGRALLLELLVTVATSALHDIDGRVRRVETSITRRLIDATSSEIFHLDLQSRGEYHSEGAHESPAKPWFDGFRGDSSVAAVTIGHPIRRMLRHLKEEGVTLEEARKWTEGEGAADPSGSHRREYQLVDNSLVRVLAGESAWELKPGGLGQEEFQRAKVALGKFEVLLRDNCLEADLPLLKPYLREGTTGDAADVLGRSKDAVETEPVNLSLGGAGQGLLRANHWDLELWDFAQNLAMSRSTTLDGYLCGLGELAKAQRTPGRGRRAVVYNSPSYHVTGVAMFSCVLVSLGFHVTAVIKEPGTGFEELLPCPHKVISLFNATIPENPYGILNPTVSEALGLPPMRGAASSDEGEEQGQAAGEEQQGTDGLEEDPARMRDGVRRRLGRAEEPRGRKAGPGRGLAEMGFEDGERLSGSARRARLYDLSVLCTAVSDANHLMKSTYPVDPRLVDALLWNVQASIWNVHSVEGAFMNYHRIPPAATAFANGVPSGKDGRKPPPTFLTTYGEHVAKWGRWSDEAYGGWGWGAEEANVTDAVQDLQGRQGGEELMRNGTHEGGLGNSSLASLFQRNGVVYPIHPVGHMRLPRPKRPFREMREDGREEAVTFVVQGNVQSQRRDYSGLLYCLEAMCRAGKGNYRLVIVGSRGEMPEEGNTLECVSNRTVVRRHLPFSQFYEVISGGHFVVTATSTQMYEYDRATSSVPTALLLERPLVMSSTLLEVYPCLRRSRVHSLVASDELCLNLEAAYDLDAADYDEMELEARECKLEMWRQARETVAALSSGWSLGM